MLQTMHLSNYESIISVIIDRGPNRSVQPALKLFLCSEESRELSPHHLRKTYIVHRNASKLHKIAAKTFRLVYKVRVKFF